MRSFTAIGLLLLLLPSAARAQDPAAEPTWLGAGGRTRPVYAGSASQYQEAVPVVRYYGPVLFVRDTRGPLEGGVHLEILPGLEAGLQLAYEEGRNTNESSFLSRHHLPNIGAGGSYGGQLEWNVHLGPAPINLILRARQHLKAEEGAQADLRLSVGVLKAGPFSAAVVGQEIWANARSNQSMYGITAQEAAISGLPVYSPGGGLVSNLVGLLWSLDLANHWLLVGNIEGFRLHEQAAQSPLAERLWNVEAVVGAAYRF
jgi:outer membrane scaffolding protein for murein synthesis (MipA/OmpV family)